jgi:hypothetical protein
MGYTNRKFPVKEISIWTINQPDHQNERVIPGDICAIRKPHYVIGLKEASELIWLRIEGLEENDFAELRSPNFDADISEEHTGLLPSEMPDCFDKRRYFIPLNRIKKIYPALDLNRAKDQNDAYQPFITIDFADSGFYYYLAAIKPFNVHGLIFDKVKGEFI